MIIGLIGKDGVGKSTIAKILQGMNFYPIVLSESNDLTTKILPVSRDDKPKQNLAQLALAKVKDGENYVVTGFSSPQEIQFLKSREDFMLVKIISPEKIRLKRIPGNKDTYTSSKDIPSGTKEISEAYNDELLKLKGINATINNDSTVEVLQKKVEKMVQDHLYKYQDSRPDWDHYFMDIAEQVKLRCTCMSAKKGAVVVKEKMIISTGYNGTPKGIEHCTLGGCKRCTSRHLGKIKSGVYSEPCICCHSEENAIVQAAYNGVSTKDAIMYTTFTPCTTCAKMIINAGITEVVAKVEYPDEVGMKLFQQAE